MARTIMVEHEGTTYFGKGATIKATHLGPEDHGLFTSYLHCDGDGWGIGVGGYVLGGTSAVEHIKAVMETVGVSRWEDLPGRQVLVLFAGNDSWGQTSKGIAHLSDETRVLDYEKWFAARRDAEAVTP